MSPPYRPQHTFLSSWKWKPFTKDPWAPLPSSAADDEHLFREEASLKKTLPRTIRAHATSSWPWIISTLIFAFLSGFLLMILLKSSFAQPPAYRSWRHTDLEPARQSIQEHEMRFDGALSYNASGNLVIESAPDREKWIGQPTPEMDKLWDRVESGSIVMLEGSEANMVRDRTALFDGYWLTGLDVIHQMHCLNKIRKALYPDYYQPEQSVATEQLHLEHCFDYIRQAIMCNADLTPVTLTWYSSAQTFGPDFRTTHMCRDFEALLEWSLARTSAAIKGRGSGMEVAKDSQLVIPGSLQESNVLGHGGH
ncbi:hypothetical protein BDV35DRAFT_353205 [Aspergillus flavus]|uniref:Tat pathway signal sequence n=1 Tax=Aspergillus flavus TaxID=5059 RepID=A0A5N6H1Z6_ASPFL|nr:hypothetical protein BDV35DRAFT_353205 [Aspergillus flavus]